MADSDPRQLVRVRHELLSALGDDPSCTRSASAFDAEEEFREMAVVIKRSFLQIIRYLEKRYGV